MVFNLLVMTNVTNIYNYWKWPLKSWVFTFKEWWIFPVRCCAVHQTFSFVFPENLSQYQSHHKVGPQVVNTKLVQKLIQYHYGCCWYIELVDGVKINQLTHNSRAQPCCSESFPLFIFLKRGRASVSPQSPERSVAGAQSKKGIVQEGWMEKSWNEVYKVF